MRGRPVADWIKKAAVRQVLVHGDSRVDVAWDLRISSTAVSNWVAAAGHAVEDPELARLRRHLEKLTAECHRLSAWNETWRKAAASAHETLMATARPGYVQAPSTPLPPGLHAPQGRPEGVPSIPLLQGPEADA